MKEDLGKILKTTLASAAVVAASGASYELSLVDNRPLENPVQVTLSRDNPSGGNNGSARALNLPGRSTPLFPYLVTDCACAECGECACACNCNCDYGRGACDCFCECGKDCPYMGNPCTVCACPESCICYGRSCECACNCECDCFEITVCNCEDGACDCYIMTTCHCYCNCICACICDCTLVCDCTPTTDCVIAACA